MRISNFIQGFGGKQPAVHSDGAEQHRASTDVLPKTRRRLFTKYVALFVAAPSASPPSKGAFWRPLHYPEPKASLLRIPADQAEAAPPPRRPLVQHVDVLLR